MTPAEIKQLLQQSPTLSEAWATKREKVWPFLREKVQARYGYAPIDAHTCEKCEKSAEIARKNMQMTSDEESARDAYLAAKRAESEAELARIEKETLALIETEQAAPIAPKSEQYQIAMESIDEEAKLAEAGKGYFREVR